MSFPPLTRRRAARLFAVPADDTGAATAEYAIATMAIVARSRHICRALCAQSLNLRLRHECASRRLADMT